MKYILRQLEVLAVALLILLLLYPFKLLFYSTAILMVLLRGLIAYAEIVQRLGERCPQCRRRKLERVDTPLPPGVRMCPPPPWFYVCPHCRARVSHQYKKGWRDASSPEFDHYYLQEETEEAK